MDIYNLYIIFVVLSVEPSTYGHPITDSDMLQYTGGNIVLGHDFMNDSEPTILTSAPPKFTLHHSLISSKPC